MFDRPKPYPTPKPVEYTSVTIPLTESDVRRIVREEMGKNHQTKPAPPGEGEG